MGYALTVVPAEVERNRRARSCGGCTACCVVFPMQFEPLHKPAWSPCRFINCGGCDIYMDRPKQCRDFTCLWLSGHLDGDERRRPDSLGLVVYNTRSPLSDFVGEHVAAIETAEGAADRPDARYMLQRLAKKVLVYVFRHGGSGHELLGPALVVRAAEAALAELGGIKGESPLVTMPPRG